jgi:hypothetical protein
VKSLYSSAAGSTFKPAQVSGRRAVNRAWSAAITAPEDNGAFPPPAFPLTSDF